MGNTGRPSTGCQTCRNKRIKCDEQKPSCLNCRKSKRVCYGYRDQLDLKFRDQNKVAKRHATESNMALEICYHETRSPLLRSFSVNPDEAVLNQFSSFCVLTGGVKEGHDTFPALIPSLYASANSTSPCIPAVSAMAWVTSAPFATTSQRMGAARRKYGEAVVKLRDALQDSRTAKADDALFTVLLMLMLENMTATSKSMPNPSKHINGAIMLVNFRGLQNFASDAGRRLFSFIKVILTALPAWHRTGILSFNDEVIEADKRACSRTHSPTLSTRLGNIAFAISVLRGKLDRADLDCPNSRLIREILQKSRNLDQELMAWRLSVPREWENFSLTSPYTHKQSLEDANSACAPTWHGSTASYPNLMIAKLMNHFRMSSIAIKTIDLRCKNWIARYCSADRPTPEIATTRDVTFTQDSSTHLKAQNVIRTLVDGICASVPFHLERLTSKGMKKSTGRDRSGRPHRQKTSGELAIVPGIMLLQPLVVAYSAPGVPADQKRWILGKTLELVKHIGMDEEMVEKTLKELPSE